MCALWFLFLSICFGVSTAFAASTATYNVKDFGATGDGTTKDTTAFQKALDTCAVSGGGTVIVPAGKFLIGSVQLGYQTVLQLDKDSVIIGSGDLADYPMLDVRWEGRWQPGHRALIYAANVDHTGIVGPGRIEGNPAVAAGQNPRGASSSSRFPAAMFAGKIFPSLKAAIGPRIPLTAPMSLLKTSPSVATAMASMSIPAKTSASKVAISIPATTPSASNPAAG